MPMTPPHSTPNLPLTPPHSNENVPPDETLQHAILDNIIPEDGDKIQILESAMQPLVENNNVQQQHMSQEHMQQQNCGYMPLYAPKVQILQQEFDKAQDVKPKKVKIIRIKFLKKV